MRIIKDKAVKTVTSMFYIFRSVFSRLAPVLIGCLFQATPAICADY